MTSLLRASVFPALQNALWRDEGLRSLRSFSHGPTGRLTHCHECLCSKSRGASAIKPSTVYSGSLERGNGARKSRNYVPMDLNELSQRMAGKTVPGELEDEGQQDEWDEEELDELLATHGEVVFSTPNTEQNSQDEDDETEAFALAVAEAANETKAAEIQVLHVKPLVYWTSFFVIVTAFSRPQSNAICKKIKDMAEERFQRVQMAGDKEAVNSWTLLDYGDVVIHIFLPRDREFYNLAEFYGNAKSIPLPFLDSATSPSGSVRDW
eukprot:TRINITY_DN4410_c0_g1_i1.p1 TRINITY_DN4410_c0_g1~~TRINITY_DN4410_c0_g1_i1.p1  ORF type:complete len:266 (+),score=54.46 TRINITY_DN4410_c0_g1_i1:97-894(+)